MSDQEKTQPELDIQELLKNYGKDLVEEMINYVDKTFKSYDDEMQKRFEKFQPAAEETEPKPETNSELEVLRSRVEEFEARQKENERLQHEGNIKSVIRKAVGNHKLTDPALIDDLVGIISGQLGYDYTSTDKGYLNKGGKSLQEDLSAFFDTALGKNFLAPSQKYGTGDTINESGSNTNPPSKPTVEEALMKAF
jgi:hypothetical protein